MIIMRYVYMIIDEYNDDINNHDNNDNNHNNGDDDHIM